MEDSFTEASESHKLCHWESAAPVCMSDGILYYMSRTELVINGCDTTSQIAGRVCEFESNSFIAPDEYEASNAAGEREKWMRIEDETSFIVAMTSPFS